MVIESYYEILGVTPQATATEIRQAFLRLAQTSHPDLQSADSLSDAEFKAIREAYEVLHNPDRRANYDHELDLQAREEPFAAELEFTTRNFGDTEFKTVVLKDFTFGKERLLFLFGGVFAGLTLAFVWYLVQGERNSINRTSQDVSLRAAMQSLNSQKQQKEKEEQGRQSSDPKIKRHDDPFRTAIDGIRLKKEDAPAVAKKADQEVYPRGSAMFETHVDTQATTVTSLPVYPSSDEREVHVPSPPHTADQHNPIGSYSGPFNTTPIPQTQESDGAPANDPVAMFHQNQVWQNQVWQKQAPAFFSTLPSQADLAAMPLPNQAALPNQAIPGSMASPLPSTTSFSGSGYANSHNSASYVGSVSPVSPLPHSQQPLSQHSFRSQGLNGGMQNYSTFPQSNLNRPRSSGYSGLPTFSGSSFSRAPTTSSLQRSLPTMPATNYPPTRSYSTGRTTTGTGVSSTPYYQQ